MQMRRYLETIYSFIYLFHRLDSVGAHFFGCLPVLTTAVLIISLLAACGKPMGALLRSHRSAQPRRAADARRRRRYLGASVQAADAHRPAGFRAASA